jgi:hypothetical protein
MTNWQASQKRLAAGEDFDSVQRRHDVAIHPAGVKYLVPLESAVDLHQHVLQRRQGKTVEAIAKYIILKSATGSHPVPEAGSCAVSSLPSSPVDFVLLACCMQEEQDPFFRLAIPGAGETNGNLPVG